MVLVPGVLDGLLELRFVDRFGAEEDLAQPLAAEALHAAGEARPR